VAGGCWFGQSNVSAASHMSGFVIASASVANLCRHSEALYEDESFPERELAALVAAKVYYQLQEYNESMVFALGAGKLFDIHHSGEFEETILGTSCAQTHGMHRLVADY
jgi:hypothetical protein